MLSRRTVLRLSFITSTAIVLFISSIRVAFGASGTEGAAFLNIPVGAEPAALGSAYTAMAHDAYAPVWNPAGLGYLQGPELAGQHLSYLDSLNYEFFSLAYPLKLGQALGFSVQYLGASDFTGIDRNQQATGNFSSYYAAYSLAYGQKLRYAPVSLGVTAKLIQARLADVGAHAYAFDAGAMYRPNETWNLGASLTNIGTPLAFLSEGDSLPMAGKVGAAYHPRHDWDMTCDLVFPRAEQPSLHTGISWNLWDSFFLRAGYKTDTLKGLSPLAGLTTGMGLSLFGQEFSYAWVPMGDLGDTHYFSLVLKFGEAQKGHWNFVQHNRPLVMVPAQQEYPYAMFERLDNDQAATEIGALIEDSTEHKAEAPQAPNTETNHE